jgi:hypothetical protein
MLKSLRYCIALGLLLALAPVASAQTTFEAWIENEQEVSNPPVPEQGTGGFGRFVLSADMTSLSYDITLFGLDIDGLQTPGILNDNAARFHIHAAPRGSNGGIVFGMKDPNHDLDDLVINPGTSRITGVWDGLEGNGTTLAAQLPALLANGLYFNVHTPDHTGGEVRGQIMIPEPSSLALLGICGLALVRRRQR